jgi:hypothetical protein
MGPPFFQRSIEKQLFYSDSWRTARDFRVLLLRFFWGTKSRTLYLYREIRKYWYPPTRESAFYGTQMCAAHVQDTYSILSVVVLLPRFLGVPRFALSLYTEKYVNVGTPPRWRVHSMGPECVHRRARKSEF